MKIFYCVIDKGRCYSRIWLTFVLPLSMTKELRNIYKTFPRRTDCILYLEDLLWSKKPVCPYCGSNKNTPAKNEERYHCNSCHTTYSVTVGTIFHKTKVDLQKWYYVVSLITSTDISARQLSKEIGVTKDTACMMVKKAKRLFIDNGKVFDQIRQSCK